MLFYWCIDVVNVNCEGAHLLVLRLTRYCSLPATALLDSLFLLHSIRMPLSYYNNNLVSTLNLMQVNVFVCISIRTTTSNMCTQTAANNSVPNCAAANCSHF
jgi:hypothetical protein